MPQPERRSPGPPVHQLGRFRSFPRGHTYSGFVGAGLSCAFHEHLNLFANEWYDSVTCAALLATATATGVLRMGADKHYASDVVVGAALGVTVGYLLPTTLHVAKVYARGRESIAAAG